MTAVVRPTLDFAIPDMPFRPAMATGTDQFKCCDPQAPDVDFLVVSVANDHLARHPGWRPLVRCEVRCGVGMRLWSWLCYVVSDDDGDGDGDGDDSGSGDVDSGRGGVCAMVVRWWSVPLAPSRSYGAGLDMRIECIYANMRCK